ncbi:transcriptional regulator [Entomophthora muscae]|uniref:Transcriptional regulator n=1 Tax=Entomophthora muscae TaxID=34485 RepID=A0ACC2TU32_9FUNG|nr:transcriptional regulator [Entomophthora muscae]
MHRGNQPKGPTGRPANWPSTQAVQGTVRPNGTAYVQHYSLTQSQPQTFLLNSINNDNYPGDPTLLNYPESGISQHSYSHPQETRKEDFPALTLNRNSSFQTVQKALQPTQPEPKREPPVSQTKVVRSRAQAESEQQSYATKASFAKKQDSAANAEKDKYGISSFVKAMKGECTHADSHLMFGTPLDTLNLKLDDPTKNVYDNFGSPWEKDSTKFLGPSKDPEWFLPPVYSASNPPNALGKIGLFSDSTLFYIFYSMPKDILQELAAQELRNRNWRYHKERQLWVTKKSANEVGQKITEHDDTVEVFYPRNWEIKSEKMVLNAENFEDRSHTGHHSSMNQLHHSVPQAIPPHIGIGSSYNPMSNPPLQQHAQSGQQHSHPQSHQQQAMYIYKQHQVPVQYNQQHPSGLAGISNHAGPQHLGGPPPQQHPHQMHNQPPPLSSQQSHLHGSLSGMSGHPHLGPHPMPNHMHPSMYNNGPHYGPSNNIPSGLSGMGLPTGYGLPGSGPNMGLPPQHHGVTRMKDY